MYANLLLGASVAAGAALLLGALRRLGLERPRSLGIWAGACTAAALGLETLAIAVHVAWDHAPGTEAELPPVEFVREHPALVVIALVALAALAIDKRSPA